ncbi:hypothetical protein H7K15_25100 [Mycobacterium parmense]|nr:hypothetical protein [Mycobacterium parmense]
MGAALAGPLMLAGAFLLVGRLHSTPSDVLDHPVDPVTDEQSAAQVIDSARQIVSLTGLKTQSAGYLLMSCRDRENPPYQGAVYLTFTLAADAHADSYFETIASTLHTHGWTEGLAPNNHALASTLTRNGVTVTIYRRDDDPGLGVARIYGQCRNMNDHRADTTWIDVTDRITKAG